MPALNPFLRALFSSSVLSSALDTTNYVLLVPTTDSLVNARDRDIGRAYSELCEDEEFLGSHILRIVGSSHEKDNSLRESRSKAKTYNTVNGRTVVIKDQVVYTQKNFKSLQSAQLLHDQLFTSPSRDNEQWLIVYITRPLIGNYERVDIPLPLLVPAISSTDGAGIGQSSFEQPAKKDIRTFNDLLNAFPLIARQMQPGLERVFNEFGKELGKPLPPPPSRSPSSTSLDNTTLVSEDPSSGSTKSPNGSVRLPFNTGPYFEDEEDLMRRALETAVTASIDLFQDVDKQQLSLLGATTDLTGPAVERLIERYVAESVHHSLLFPRLCAFHRPADHDLNRRIKQMDCLDVSQVGISLDGSTAAKRDLMLRVDRGVTCFRKMGVAASPQEMLEILLETQKVVSDPASIADPEKRAVAMTINADILVSLLLIVVTRSGIRHLQARLSCMQRFIFIDDVESGEMGYALSTLEAVLAYLASDAGGLRRTSRQNCRLWNAVKLGKIDEIKSIFRGEDMIVDPELTAEVELPKTNVRPTLSRSSTKSHLSVGFESSTSDLYSPEEDGNLSHVFPFQKSSIRPHQSNGTEVLQKKRVKLKDRTLSISSSMSLLSRTATLESTLSGMEGDTSIHSLAKTCDTSGNSVLMMAIEARQLETIVYLLSLDEHYPPLFVAEDKTLEGATLLSAAIQLPDLTIANAILDYIESNCSIGEIKDYLAKQDNRGRTCAHYLFNTPSLIGRLGHRIPWRLRDKLGQTPLFSICRAYDHPSYSTMILQALVAARQEQQTSRRLDLHDHTDNKGNSLLHILNDPAIVHKALHQCDSDPNYMNDRKFTPLMLASKYGRIDVVRIFFGDPRVDLYLREARGFTAVELAKDDEVRNRIDDLTLFSDPSGRDADEQGRLTAIVRSLFVEDSTQRYIIKSGAPHINRATNTYTITTSRRSGADFVNLMKWLNADNPASYVPAMHGDVFRSPYQIHSKPSRAILHFSQTQLDRLLKVLLAHPSFSTHEVLWEFFLVPDMQPAQIDARSKLKATLIQEKIAEDYEPIASKPELEAANSVAEHSYQTINRQQRSLVQLLRCGHTAYQASVDLVEALDMFCDVLDTLAPPSTTLPASYTDAVQKFVSHTHTETQSNPMYGFLNAQISLMATTFGLSKALLYPTKLVEQIRGLMRQRNQAQQEYLRESRPRTEWINLPALEASRKRTADAAKKKEMACEHEIDKKGKNLRYVSEVTMNELAAYTTWREDWAKKELRRLTIKTLIKEKERLRCMQRVWDGLQKSKSDTVPHVAEQYRQGDFGHRVVNGRSADTSQDSSV